MRITLLVLTFFPFLSLTAQEWQWARQFEDSSLNKAVKMVVDKEGNTTMMGSFRSRELIWGKDTLSPISSPDFFIAQLNSDGDPTWVIQGINKMERTSAGTSLHDIEVDDDGNIYVVGSYVDTLTLGGQRITNRFLPEIKVQNFFYTKINKDGEIEYLKHAEGERRNYCRDVTHQEGRTYIAGGFIQDILLDGQPFGLDTIFRTNFIAEIDEQGQIVWLNSMANMDCVKAGPNGDLHVFGVFSDSVQLGQTIIASPAVRGFYYARLNANGELDESSIRNGWVGSDLVSDRIDIADAEVDENGNIIFTGSFTGSFLQYGSEVVPKGGEISQFVIKMDGTGALQWYKSTGGVAVPWILSPDIEVVNDDIYYYSFFDNNLDLDIGVLESRGGVDALLLLLDQDGNTVFADHYGGIYHEFGYGICANNDYEVWIFGEYQRNLRLGNNIDLEGVTLNNVYVAKTDFNEIASIFNNANTPEYFEVYPNPASESIEIPNGLDWESLYIFNGSGQLLQTGGGRTNGAHIIDVSQWSSGSYVIVLTNDKYTYLSKFLVK